LCMITFIFVKIGDDKAVVFVGDWFVEVGDWVGVEDWAVELDNRVVELDNSASTPLPSLLCMYRVRLIFSPTFEWKSYCIYDVAQKEWVLIFSNTLTLTSRTTHSSTREAKLVTHQTEMKRHEHSGYQHHNSHYLTIS
jgi:hypothetical protein